MAFIQNDSSVQTHHMWLSQLNIDNRPKNNYRRTSIICTIGPKTNSVEAINKLRKGMLTVSCCCCCCCVSCVLME